MSKLRVAIIAPPWLSLPIEGYGGIELVLEGLIAGLMQLDVDITLYASGPRKLKGIKTRSLYSSEQYTNIQLELYDNLPIALAHLQFALNDIEKDGHFDIIHDHSTFLGPMALSLATRIPGLPPALHTLHGPPFSTKQMLDQGIPDNKPMFAQLERPGNLYYVGISNTLMKTAPPVMKAHTLPAVHNAIEMEFFPFIGHKKEYFITLARFNPDKGQHIAIKGAVKHKKRLRMAGTVAGIGNNRKLLLELSNPLSSYRNNKDFRYYSDKIFKDVVRHRNITYSGNLSGSAKIKFIAEAKALLFPIQWEEPFGMSVIEALACGTPVIAMNRGAMPEIIEHGVTGFLAKNEQEFIEYMGRIDEIDPVACRRSVEKRFSAIAMAKEYIKRYKKVIALSTKQKRGK